MQAGVLICRRDPLPLYYSPSEGRKMGAGHNGWTPDPDLALAFAREKDAKEFAEVLLPQLAPACTYPEHKLAEKVHG